MGTVFGGAGEGPGREFGELAQRRGWAESGALPKKENGDADVQEMEPLLLGLRRMQIA